MVQASGLTQSEESDLRGARKRDQWQLRALFSHWHSDADWQLWADFVAEVAGESDAVCRHRLLKGHRAPGRRCPRWERRLLRLALS